MSAEMACRPLVEGDDVKDSVAGSVGGGGRFRSRDGRCRDFGTLPQRIVKKVRVSHGRLHLGVAQQRADDLEGCLPACEQRGERMPEIMDPQVEQTRLQADFSRLRGGFHRLHRRSPSQRRHQFRDLRVLGP